MPTVDFSQLPEGPPPDFTYLNSAYVKVYDDGTDRYLANFIGLGDAEPVDWYWSTYAYDIADNDNMHVVEAEVTFTGTDDKIELRFRAASDGSSYHGVRLEQNGAAFWVHEGGGGGFSWTPPTLGTKWRFRLEYMGVTSTQTLLRVWVDDTIVYDNVADGFKTGVYAGFQMSAAARMHRWGFPYGIETEGAPQLRWSEQAYADASSVNLPADEVQEGDLLVAWVTSDTNGEGVGSFSPPSGWTEEAEDAALSTYLGWHWKVAGASEPTSYTFTGGGAHLSVAMMIVKAGTFDPDNPIADCNLGIDNVASTVEIAGVTTGADNALALAGTFAIYQGYPTGPEEFSVVEHISNGWVFTTVVQAELGTAGSHGPWTVTSPEPRGAGVIVINPAGGDGPGEPELLYASDDFNRADSADFGPDWTELADGDGEIVNNEAIIPTGSGESCLAWTTPATTAKQFSQHTVTADWVNNTSRGPFICSDLSSDTAGYMVNWRASDNRWRIWRNQTNVHNVNAGPDIVAGDVIRIESEPSGSNLIVRTFHNGNLVNEYTDTSPLAGRHVGFNLRTGQVSADDWSGGDVDAEPLTRPMYVGSAGVGWTTTAPTVMEVPDGTLATDTVLLAFKGDVDAPALTGLDGWDLLITDVEPPNIYVSVWTRTGLTDADSVEIGGYTNREGATIASFRGVESIRVNGPTYSATGVEASTSEWPGTVVVADETLLVTIPWTTWRTPVDATGMTAANYNLPGLAMFYADADAGAFGPVVFTLNAESFTLGVIDLQLTVVPSEPATGDFEVVDFISSTSNTDGVSFTLVEPPQAGDVIFISLNCITNASYDPVPEGWTNVLPGSDLVVPSDGSIALGMLYHAVTQAEAAASKVTWDLPGTWAVAEECDVLVAVVRGVNPVNPVRTVSTVSNASNSTVHVLPAVSGSGLAEGGFVLRAVMADDTSTYTTPVGHTQIITSNVYAGSWLGFRDTLTVEDTEVPAVDIAAAFSGESAGISVVLAPAPQDEPNIVSADGTISGTGTIDAEGENIGPPLPRPSDAVLVWNFVTSAQDISGNGNHGTVSGAEVSDGEVFFTGGQSGQYVEWAHGALVPADQASVLLRADSGLGQSGCLWTRMRANDSSSFNVSLTGSGAVEGVVRTYDGVAVVSSDPIVNEYDVGLVYDGSEVRLYIDGVEVDSVALTGDIDVSGGSSFDRFRIGYDPNNPYRTELGFSVLDVAWYHRALTPTEVASYAPIDEEAEYSVVTRTATVAGSGTLSGSGVKVISSTASLAGSGSLTAAGIRTTDTTGSLAGSGQLSASGLIVKFAGGTLSGTGSLESQGARVVSSSSSISGTGALSGTKLRITNSTGSLEGTGSITSVGRGFSTVTSDASLSGVGELSGTFKRITQGVSEAIEGVSTISGTGTRITHAQGSLSGTCQLDADTTLVGVKTASGSIDGDSELAGAGVRVTAKGATVTSFGLLEGSGRRIASSSGSLAGESELDGSSLRVSVGSGTLASQSSLSAERVIVKSRSASMSADGSLSATGAIVGLFFAEITGTSELSGTGERIVSRNSSLSGVGAISSTSTRLAAADGTVTGSGDLDSDGRRIVRAEGSIQGAGTLTSDEKRVLARAATLEGQGELESTALSVVSAGGTISGAGSITANGSGGRGLAATLSGQSVLSATGTRVVVANGHIVSSSSLSGSSARVVNRSATVSGQAILTGTAVKLIVRAGTISGVGTITATSPAFTPLNDLKAIGTVIRQEEEGYRSVGGILVPQEGTPPSGLAGPPLVSRIKSVSRIRKL